ncbi:S41 family peptidase [Ammoniphilus sp. CFH 90114]|uniref:S41 family peptidase n=1 Tax=Ammoniphilus sp. CFH 90114 TaxID=2493665 RepID=UPI00100FCB38|nr:S41 family peptidase [Ammoniphilus sp. CFH 90114]RXT04497.1 PDZ domain-containing protein [Ammoniphilus sp. CFH 90114]
MLHRYRRSILHILCISFIFSSFETFAAEEKDPNRSKLIEVYDMISQYHIKEIPKDEVSTAAIWGMIDALGDPHTAYFTDRDFQEFIASMEGTYNGIGVVVGQEHNGSITIRQVYENSPAKRAGLQPGDRLMEIDGKRVIDQSIETVLNKLRGDAGSKIQMRFMSTDHLYEVELIRERIEVPIVQSSMLEGQTGYIQLSSFSQESSQLFKERLDKLIQEGAKSFVIDLRDNPGGFLDSAVSMSSFFIKEGPVLHVRNKNDNQMTISVENGVDFPFPLALLVNEYSASAAEVLAAVLKEYGKATLIGARTFGKGTVQEVIPLKSGGFLKLTLEEYFTPKRNRMDHTGVSPHIQVGDTGEQFQAALYVLRERNVLTLKSSEDVLINYKADRSGTPAAIYEDGKWFVSARKLAYLFHGEISYDQEIRKVRLKISGDEYLWSLEGRALVRKGTFYLPIEVVLNHYIGLEKINAGDHITLQLRK